MFLQAGKATRLVEVGKAEEVALGNGVPGAMAEPEEMRFGDEVYVYEGISVSDVVIECLLRYAETGPYSADSVVAGGACHPAYDEGVDVKPLSALTVTNSDNAMVQYCAMINSLYSSVYAWCLFSKMEVSEYLIDALLYGEHSGGVENPTIGSHGCFTTPCVHIGRIIPCSSQCRKR